jgi:hypothetical protein
MPEDKDAARARAEAKFTQQEQRSRDAEAARADEVAKAKAVDEKTARLKRLRLAKEAADLDAAGLAKREGAARVSGGHARRGEKKSPA